MHTIDVVMLVHNEQDTIEKEIFEVIETFRSQGWRPNLIIIEDGSLDGTPQVLNSLYDRELIHLVSSRQRLGYCQALILGLKSAKSNHVLFLDSGKKFFMSDVLDLVNGNSVADMILGYRVDRSDAASRRIFTWVYNKLIRILFPKVSVHDADVGLRLYRKEVVSQILKQDLFFSELLSSEITIRVCHLGYTVSEFPVRYRGRNGTSRALPPKKIIKVIPRAILRLFILRVKLS